ncbi:alpha/beta fold hydrolase [Aureispira anguillae]|uniref:Alpha/beta hydrolase n=1 Tax=Aureispira anguillae TaxID=2864201 RepID=A0A915YFJ6_9BACT|nr:alpha/beta hydrolase [Aureispira anguillae]BDS12063.1 alpha/beta hydrolase [Aureispira anguillae]
MAVVTYKDHQIHYHQYGKGRDLMFAFHGFADNGDLFESIATVLANEYTIIAIDMPFHGATQWQEDSYRPEDIAVLVKLWMEKFQVETCSMMCHSMGGRIVLGLLPLIAPKLKQIYFFAPAGLQYTFTASRFWCPLWFRKRAQNRFEQSEGILRFFEITHRLKLMNRATYLVFKQQLDLPRRRARLLKTWLALYYFPMRATAKHIKLLNQNKISTYFFYGKKDRITPAKFARKLVPKLHQSELNVFKGNHFFVRESLVKPFQEWYGIALEEGERTN